MIMQMIIFNSHVHSMDHVCIFFDLQAEHKKDIEKIVELQSAIKFNGGGAEQNYCWQALVALPHARAEGTSLCLDGLWGSCHD